MCKGARPSNSKKSRSLKRSTSKKNIQKGRVTKKAGTGHKRVPNMFLLYFMEMYKKHGGNRYCVAKECGRRWRLMPAAEKQKYKKLYCRLWKKCKKCPPPGDASSSDTSDKGGSGGSGGS